MRPLASHPAYRWVLVGMLWFVCFFNYADRQAIFSIFPLLRSELHLTTLQLGVIGSAFMWVYALSGPVAGWLCDRVSRKALVLGGLIFWSIVTAATALAHTYTQLIVCRALGGLGEAFYFPASMSLIADYHASGTRSRAMAIHQSSVYAGSIAGGVVSGVLGQRYGWRSSFLVFGTLGIVLGAVLWAFIREPVRGSSEAAAVLESAVDPLPVATGTSAEARRSPLAELFGNPVVVLLITVFIGANFVAVVFLTWLPTFLYEKFGMSLALAGLNGTAYLQIASVCGVLAGGFLADRAVRRGTHRASGGRMLVQAFGLLCGVPFLYLAGQTKFVPILVVTLVGFGFFKGLYDANLWASLYDVVPLRLRGTAVGWMNSLGWLGGGTAPIAVAVMAQHLGMSTAVSATAVIYLTCGMFMLMASRLRSSRAA